MIPGAAYAAIQRLAKEQNAPFPVSEKTLWKRMAEKNLLLSRDHDHNTIMKTLPGGRCRVLHLPASLLGSKIGVIGVVGESEELPVSGYDGNLHQSEFLPESEQIKASQLVVAASSVPIEPLSPIFRPVVVELDHQPDDEVEL